MHILLNCINISDNLLYMVVLILCGSRKYPYLPHGRLLAIPRGVGGEKSNIFPECPRALSEGNLS